MEKMQKYREGVGRTMKTYGVLLIGCGHIGNPFHVDQVNRTQKISAYFSNQKCLLGIFDA